MKIDKTIAVALISLLLVCGATLGTSVGYVRADDGSGGDNGSSGSDNGGGGSSSGGGSSGGSGDKGGSSNDGGTPDNDGKDKDKDKDKNTPPDESTPPPPPPDATCDSTACNPTDQPPEPVLPGPVPISDPVPLPTCQEDPHAPGCDDCKDNGNFTCGTPGGGGGGSGGSHIAFAKKGKSLVQFQSVKTDFPDNDPSAIAVHVTSAKKDSLGDYHMVGEITNRGNDTLQFVQVTGHLFDINGQPVGVTTCCYATPSDIEPGHTATFDSFAEKDHLSGKPTAFRLSYDWS